MSIPQTDPTIVVQSSEASVLETHPFNISGTYLFSYRRTVVGDLYVAIPISISRLASGQVIFHVRDIMTDQIIDLEPRFINGVFPAHSAGDFFIQNCQMAGTDVGTLHAAFSEYIQEVPTGMQDHPVFNQSRIKQLESLTQYMTWAEDLPTSTGFSESERGVIRMCIDTLFTSANAVAISNPALSGELRDVLKSCALDMVSIDPEVKAHWLDVTKAGDELVSLRRQVNNLRNQLLAAGLTPVEDTSND